MDKGCKVLKFITGGGRELSLRGEGCERLMFSGYLRLF